LFFNLRIVKKKLTIFHALILPKETFLGESRLNICVSVDIKNCQEIDLKYEEKGCIQLIHICKKKRVTNEKVKHMFKNLVCAHHVWFVWSDINKVLCLTTKKTELCNRCRPFSIKYKLVIIENLRRCECFKEGIWELVEAKLVKSELVKRTNSSNYNSSNEQTHWTCSTSSKRVVGWVRLG